MLKASLVALCAAPVIVYQQWNHLRGEMHNVNICSTSISTCLLLKGIAALLTLEPLGNSQGTEHSGWLCLL